MRIASLGLVMLFFSLSAASDLHGADRFTFRSGPAQVALIELYTSEGCSSCPPAEHWLGDLRQDAGLWKTFVPVAFHVNYWDHLGWRDALASKTFTDRERAYANAWDASSIYTPCFVRNGAEWRPRDGESGSKAIALGATRDSGTLVLTLTPEAAEGKTTWRIDFMPAVSTSGSGGGSAQPPSRNAPEYEITVALLGGGIVNKVRKGENAGRDLRHEFVALRLATTALQRGADGAWSATVSLPPRTEIVTARRAVAAWVTKRGELTPVQAVGGWVE